MTPAYENVLRYLKQLPGLGHRSAERIALHLLVEKPERLEPLIGSLQEAAQRLHPCPETGNLCEGDQCALFSDPRRDKSLVCVVEHVPDLIAIERTGTYRGTYHVLHGKLSPIQGIGPEQLNFASLKARIDRSEARELILALPNDIESEATCHYIQEALVGEHPVAITRIGFGLPSGGGVLYADAATLQNALEGRRAYPKA